MAAVATHISKEPRWQAQPLYYTASYSYHWWLPGDIGLCGPEKHDYHEFDFHNQMPKLRMAPTMAQAVVVSWCRMSDAMDQRLPYSTAPITGSYRVAVTMKWLSSAKRAVGSIYYHCMCM